MINLGYWENLANAVVAAGAEKAVAKAGQAGYSYQIVANTVQGAKGKAVSAAGSAWGASAETAQWKSDVLSAGLDKAGISEDSVLRVAPSLYEARAESKRSQGAWLEDWGDQRVADTKAETQRDWANRQRYDEVDQLASARLGIAALGGSTDDVSNYGLLGERQQELLGTKDLGDEHMNQETWNYVEGAGPIPGIQDAAAFTPGGAGIALGIVSGVLGAAAGQDKYQAGDPTSHPDYWEPGMEVEGASEWEEAYGYSADSTGGGSLTGPLSESQVKIINDWYARGAPQTEANRHKGYHPLEMDPSTGERRSTQDRKAIAEANRKTEERGEQYQREKKAQKAAQDRRSMRHADDWYASATAMGGLYGWSSDDVSSSEASDAAWASWAKRTTSGDNIWSGAYYSSGWDEEMHQSDPDWKAKAYAAMISQGDRFNHWKTLGLDRMEVLRAFKELTGHDYNSREYRESALLHDADWADNYEGQYFRRSDGTLDTDVFVSPDDAEEEFGESDA